MDMIRCTFTVLDAKGQTSKVIFHTTIDEPQTRFTIYGGQYMDAVKDYFRYVAQKLDALINGAIIDISLSVDVALPVLKVAPLANSDVEEGAEFKFPEGGGTAYFKHRIPTFDHSLFGYGQTTLNPHETSEIVAYWSALVASNNVPELQDIGGITDNRGAIVLAIPRIAKVFKPSR